VKKSYFLCDFSEVSASEELRLRLRQVTFDSREWEDEELLMLMQQMFLDLELTTTFGLDLPTLRTFLFTVYDNYNDVPFHNFRHCFCVAQMVSVKSACASCAQKF
jgi:high affinity cGMP-specific 3',5'-cyclic phosphodiesterase 9